MTVQDETTSQEGISLTATAATKVSSLLEQAECARHRKRGYTPLRPRRRYPHRGDADELPALAAELD